MRFLTTRRRRQRRRLCVLGLDGVPVGLLHDLTARGCMPHTAELLQQGTLRPMTSTLPPVSNVSWTSFLTGVNPGKHGIYGFTEVQPGAYALYFPDFRHVKSPTLWDLLGQHGRRTIALNVPGTYPARPLQGVLVSGFVALDLAKAVYPAEILPWLRQCGYRIDVDYQQAAAKPLAFFADLRRTLEARRQTFLHFLRQADWDLFIGVITGTDRLHHYFWDHYVDAQAPHHAAFLAYYRQLDALIGEMAAVAAHQQAAFLMISDHGHGLITREVYPNVWLRQEGYLRFQTTTPKSLADMHPHSRAFVLDPGRLYLNVRGKFPAGQVAPGAEYEALLQELYARLQALRLPDHEALPLRIWRKEELYSGPYVAQAPDLVLHGPAGFDLKGAIARQSLLGKTQLTGMHTLDDALCYVREEQLQAEALRIVDLAPTILALLELPIPPEMDGKVLIPRLQGRSV